ncbi:hypothetical protein RDWZM_009873, partial [Blomia tropicalis]
QANFEQRPMSIELISYQGDCEPIEDEKEASKYVVDTCYKKLSYGVKLWPHVEHEKDFAYIYCWNHTITYNNTQLALCLQRQCDHRPVYKTIRDRHKSSASASRHTRAMLTLSITLYRTLSLSRSLPLSLAVSIGPDCRWTWIILGCRWLAHQHRGQTTPVAEHKPIRCALQTTNDNFSW